MPKVSVIISTYNRPESLKKAIESVLNQTFQDFEIIVVNDGGQNTARLINNFNDNRVKYIIRTDNFGNDTKPKNTGILESKGEYISFLDDDNTFRPDHLQLLVNELENNPDIDIVYGDRWLTDKTGKVKPQVGKYSDYQPGKLMIENYIDTSDVLVRREALFYAGGFDEEQKKYIDWNLWVRMEKAGFRFKRVPIIITDYTLDSDSKSLTKFTKKEEAFMKANPGKFAIIPDFDPIDCEIRLPYLGEVPKPKVAIFTLTYDRLELTKKSFESLHKTAGYDFDHYVIDNGSKDGTVEWLHKQAKEKKISAVINYPENKGISIASNQAINIIQDGNYDIIVKVDNDAEFIADGWLSKMVDIWKSNHQIIMSCYVEGLKDNPGGAPRYHRGQVKGELIGMANHLGGVCVFADARAYKNFRWDENDYLHSAQDLAFSQYVTTNGYAMAYLENYSLRHVTSEMEEKYPEYFERRKKEKRTKYEKSKS